MNAPVPQRIKMMEVEQLWQRILALEAANAKCCEAIAAAVQAEREAQAKRDEALIRLIENDRRIDAETARDYAAAIRARNGGKGE